MKKYLTGLPPEIRPLLSEAVDRDGRITNESKAVSALTDYVVLYEEPVILFEMCLYISPVDMEEAIFKVSELLKANGRFSYKKRKMLIDRELKKCIAENDVLNFTGFLQFRLSEYENLLLVAVMTALFQ